MKKQSSYQKLQQRNKELFNDIRLMCCNNYEAERVKAKYSLLFSMTNVVMYGRYNSKKDGLIQQMLESNNETKEEVNCNFVPAPGTEDVFEKYIPNFDFKELPSRIITINLKKLHKKAMKEYEKRIKQMTGMSVDEYFKTLQP
jgi:hypothetical protein